MSGTWQEDGDSEDEETAAEAGEADVDVKPDARALEAAVLGSPSARALPVGPGRVQVKVEPPSSPAGPSGSDTAAPSPAQDGGGGGLGGVPEDGAIAPQAQTRPSPRTRGPGPSGRARQRGRRRERRRRRGQQRAQRRQRVRAARRHAATRTARATRDYEARPAAAGISAATRSSRPRRRSQSPTSSRASSSSRGQSRSRSPRRRRSVEGPAAGLTPTPGSPRPAPVPERAQPQPCFLEGCPWRGGADEVVGHARERHASLVTPGPSLRLVVPLIDDQELDLLRLVDALDELFILQLKRRAGAKRKLQAAVRLLGSRTRAASYVYLIQMQQVSDDQDGGGSGSGSGGSRGATRVAFLVSPAHSWLEPADEALRSLWAARHYARPLPQRDSYKILELSVTVQKAQQE